jgi:hypothetical protein
MCSFRRHHDIISEDGEQSINRDAGGNESRIICLQIQSRKPECDKINRRKTMKQKILHSMFAVLVCAAAQAQINTGSSGSDGALDYSSLTNLGYSTNIVINMADHPTGIYQYTYVTIPNNVTVTFIPNATNSPLIWLVQSNVVINGTVDVSGQFQNGQYGGSQGGLGGPGGWAGGNGGSEAAPGQGPGGGPGGQCGSGGQYSYGNAFLIPLLGGSGGGGSTNCFGENGGGGGGGAILIAASQTITVNGNLNANGGNAPTGWGGGPSAGGGSGGAIRLVASLITGNGWIHGSGGGSGGGSGMVRFDTYQNTYSGGIQGVNFTQGSQFIIIPSAGQLPQLTIATVGGVPVSTSPTGALTTPDAVLSAQQNNPIPIVVNCANLPLNSLITVTVTPINGSSVSATGYNTTGTLASSTATVSIVIPRGGGLIYATATTGN